MSRPEWNEVEWRPQPYLVFPTIENVGSFPRITVKHDRRRLIDVRRSHVRRTTPSSQTDLEKLEASLKGTYNKQKLITE